MERIIIVLLIITILYLIFKERIKLISSKYLQDKEGYSDINQDEQNEDINEYEFNEYKQDNSILKNEHKFDDTIVFKRKIYTNNDSRLRSYGDPIRGDLPIKPVKGDWFIPAGAKGNNMTNILQQGAMNVLGGLHNNTNKKLMNLFNENQVSKDDYRSTFGGIKIENN